MTVIKAFVRNTKSRCQRCGRVPGRLWDIRPTEIQGVSEEIQKLAPIGSYCHACAKSLTQAFEQASKEENEDTISE